MPLCYPRRRNILNFNQLQRFNIHSVTSTFMFENYNNKEFRHLYTDSPGHGRGCKRWNRDGDAERRFISWSASRRASSSISFSSRSSLFVSEKFPVMSFVGRFPCRTEKLNAKVLSDIQFHDAAGKRDLRTPLRRNLDTLDNHNVPRIIYASIVRRDGKPYV